MQIKSKNKDLILILIVGFTLSFSLYAQSHITADFNIGSGAVVYNPKTGPEVAPLNSAFYITWLPLYKDFLVFGALIGLKFRIPNSWDSLELLDFESAVDIGMGLLYRKYVDWALSLSFVGTYIYTPYTAVGCGIRSFFAYYITAGFGFVFGVNGYWYYGVESVLTLGYGVGIILDYEYWKE